MMVWILDTLGVSVFLEQPVNSLLERHPSFVFFSSKRDWHRASIMQDRFGGSTRKPTWIYSNDARVQDLRRYSTSSSTSSQGAEHEASSLTSKKRRADGSMSITGKKAR